MPFYQELKTTRGAAIGTIMPWTGGISNIPSGWILCDGQVVAADDFPLLAAAIGDTYNAGTSDFTGTGANAFPNYGGSIKLPDLNGKTLMDVETSYFADRSSGGTGRPADLDVQALTLLSPKIGTNQSNSVTTIFTDVFVDIEFTLPTSERSGYQGRIKGNTLINGDGFKTVYIGPRKLGRSHIKRHNHSGSLSTIDNSTTSKPGYGVVPYGDVSYQLFSQGVDNDGQNEAAGDMFYFGWTSDLSYRGDSPDVEGNGESNESETYQETTADIVGGIIGASGWDEGTGLPSQDLYTLRWPDEASGDETENGYGQGGQGKVLAKVASEQPPINLKPKFVFKSPLSDEFITNASNSPNGKYIKDQVKFGIGGGDVGIPSGFTNFYDTAMSDSSVGDTLLSNPGRSFLNDSGSEDRIFAHTHDEFDVGFDSTRMRPQSNITANANIPFTTDVDNTPNRNALQVDFNVEQPRVTSIYIIRAY